MFNKIHRRSIVALSATAALLLAGCGTAQPAATAIPPATSTVAPAPAAESTATTPAATPTNEATAVATTAAAAPTAASTAQDTTPKIVAAANAFLATLTETQKSAVLFDWSNTAQKQRWSNLPQGLYTRAGLMWGNLTDAQKTAWLAVMQATLSSEGYTRVMAEWNADDALAAAQSSSGSSTTGGAPPSGTMTGTMTGTMGGPPSGAMTGTMTGTVSGTVGAGGPGGGGPGGGGGLLFGKQYYWVAIIGTPSETSAWQWQWGGHHVTVNSTIVGTNVALTPSFIGVQPAVFTDSKGSAVRPLGDIEDEAFALVNSLDATQQKAAVLGSAGIDLVLGPGQDGKTIVSEGLPASQMTADQQAALLKFIGHYTGLVNDEDAATRMAEIKATLDQTYMAWYGPTTAGSAAYFRVTGPTLVIEFAPQGGGGTGTGLGGDTTNLHIHGIYRDPTNDYGAKITK